MKPRKFAERVERIAVSAIKQMPLLARSVPGAVSLGQGIPSLRTPASVRTAVANALDTRDDIGKYSLQPGLPALKEEISKLLSERTGRPVDTEREIFVSAGAMEALLAAIVSIVEEGDEVLLFDPGYASHIEQVLFAGGRPVFVPLDESQEWGVNLDALRQSITANTKAVIVCNPNNPTGSLLRKDELKAIVDIAREFDLYIIADETYNFLVFDDEAFVSLTTFEEVKDLVIACYSFSKQFAMTGWRVGYMYAPACVIDQVLKVHDATVICAPTVSQYAALAALTECKPNETEEIFRALSNRRDLTCARLDELAGLFTYVRPRGAYYVLPKFNRSDVDSMTFAMRMLHEAKVIVIPGRAFGPQGEGHIRISFGGTENEINEAFDRIEKWNKTL